MRTATRLRSRLVAGLALSAAVAGAAALWTYATVPKGNAGPAPVDLLLVLGSPANADGGLSRVEWWRVNEGVREYQAGVAPRVLFAGAAVANRFAEGSVMARYALLRGVPAEAVLVDTGSRTTLENIRNAVALMQAHGWQRVEVVTSPEHVKRSSVILNRMPVEWRMQPAPTPGNTPARKALGYAEEFVGTVAWRWFGEGAEPVLHTSNEVQGWVRGRVHWIEWKFGLRRERV